MGIKLNWEDSDRTVFRVIYEGDWSMQEFFETYDQSRAMIARVDHSIVLILDMTNSGNPPGRFFAMINLVRQRKMPEVSLVIIVGGNALFRGIAVALKRLAPEAQKRLRFTDTLEDARLLAEDCHSKQDRASSYIV